MATILLIDDDRAFQGVLGPYLAADGWNVISADDGEAGLALAETRHPRVVICDLLMPRCNGYQVCRALRAEPEKYGLPKIIITSGSTYSSDRQNALEAGADAFLVKPVSPKELAATVLSLASTTENKPQPSQTRIRFWGVRGSIPTPGASTLYFGGNTSCVEVRSGQEIIILDSGTGIRPLGLQLVEEFKNKPIHLTLLITHTHWDHIQGFPFFVPAYDPNNNLRILGFDGARKGLERTFSNQMESPYFPISMEQMPGNIRIEELKDLNFHVGNIPVQAAFLNHPGICVGYRLFTPGGSVSYLPDNELHQRLSVPKITSHSETDYTFKYAQSQDQKLMEFVHGSDVLIIDSQYDSAEYATHAGWGHSCVDDTVALALSAEVKQLFLFHHDPNHDDGQIKQMVAHARDIAAKNSKDLVIDAAREGVEIVIASKEAK